MSLAICLLAWTTQMKISLQQPRDEREVLVCSLRRVFVAFYRISMMIGWRDDLLWRWLDWWPQWPTRTTTLLLIIVVAFDSMSQRERELPRWSCVIPRLIRKFFKFEIYGVNWTGPIGLGLFQNAFFLTFLRKTGNLGACSFQPKSFFDGLNVLYQYQWSTVHSTGTYETPLVTVRVVPVPVPVL